MYHKKLFEKLFHSFPDERYTSSILGFLCYNTQWTKKIKKYILSLPSFPNFHTHVVIDLVQSVSHHL